VATLRAFADSKSITFSLLSDEGSKTIDAYGLRNRTMREGSRQDGIPHPGTFIVDRGGIIRARLPGTTRERHSTQALLEAARSLVAPAGAPSAELLFFDDFSGPELDRKQWNVQTTGRVFNDEQQAYVDSKETVYTVSGDAAEGAERGVLAIHPRFRPGFETPEERKFDFIPGRIHTKGLFDFTHGRASDRIKLPDAPGAWPAFWALGNERWPQTGEIDIMEHVGEPDWTSVALHGPGYSGETPLVNKAYFPEGADASGWHVYAVDWSPEGSSSASTTASSTT
jgi:beta-glucanase (GH16 family)